MDYLTISIYFIFVVFIDFLLRSKVKIGKAFFFAESSNPSWMSDLVPSKTIITSIELAESSLNRRASAMMHSEPRENQ
jgi:hypothetical protein